MNKTIKKKKNAKNKTQKKRVQSGGTPQDEIDKIKPLIIKYINHNTHDPRVESERQKEIVKLESAIQNLDNLIKTNNEKTTKHIKDNSFTKLDINNEKEQTNRLIQKKEGFKQELGIYQRYKQTCELTKNEIHNIIKNVSLKLSNPTKGQITVITYYNEIFDLVLKNRTDSYIMDFIQKKLDTITNSVITKPIEDALTNIKEEIQESKISTISY
jgi:hypothetical protein